MRALTRRLAGVAFGRAEPDLVIKDARVLSTYSENRSCRKATTVNWLGL